MFYCNAMQTLKVAKGLVSRLLLHKKNDIKKEKVPQYTKGNSHIAKGHVCYTTISLRTMQHNLDQH